jgi:LPXTG-motif cell wall-anchored protein
MKTKLYNAVAAVSLAVVITVVGMMVVAPFAFAAEDDKCSGEKYDVVDLPATTADGVVITLVDADTVHFDLPDGAVSADICVKAGSAQQGDGPEYLTITGDADVDHSTGKELSHVSVIDVTFEEPDPDPSPSPDPDPSPSPDPDPDPSPEPDPDPEPSVEPPNDDGDDSSTSGKKTKFGPLPNTGFSATAAAAWGVIALLVGITALVAARKGRA